jgi:hypothetical protein
MTEKEEGQKSVNEGTEAKKTLQSQTLRYMASYPIEQTLMDYAELLCWDICVTRRTAFESYVLPMLKHGYLKYVGKSSYSGKSIYNFINPQKPQEQQIDYTKESEQKYQLVEAIQTELSANPKLTESDIIQKFSTKEIDEEQVKFCYDIAKNRILIIKSQKKGKGD